AVALFQSRFPRSPIVLTSRVYAYREPCLLPPPFQVATLQPLEPAAQEDFIGHWYRAALLHGSGLASAEQEQIAIEKSRDHAGGLKPAAGSTKPAQAGCPGLYVKAHKQAGCRI